MDCRLSSLSGESVPLLHLCSFPGVIDRVDSRSTCLPGSFPVDSAREIKLGEKTVGESALVLPYP